MFHIYIKKIKTFIRNPKTLSIKLLTKFSFLFNDQRYLKIIFKLKTGKKLRLEKPQTFNEKLQWLKLNYRKRELVTLVDKYASKEVVSKLIGEDYIIPTFGVWDNFEEINFERLPNQFVLKTTHDQGGVVICKNKQEFDIKKAKTKLNKHLKINHYFLSREWPYKDVKPRIIAEKLMVDESGFELKDYKFFCFEGIPKALFIATDRQTGNVKFDFYDMDFNHLDITQIHEQSGKLLEKPKGFSEMIRLSKILSKNYPHIRIDFYDIGGKIYFGEFTFFHHGGLVPFHPHKWDYIFGTWINLPQ